MKEAELNSPSRFILGIPFVDCIVSCSEASSLSVACKYALPDTRDVRENDKTPFVTGLNKKTRAGFHS